MSARVREIAAGLSLALFVVFVAAASVCGAELLPQGPHKDSADTQITGSLAAPPQTGWTSVLIRIDGPLTSERKEALNRLGADVYRHLSLIHSLAARVPSRNLARLAALPFVSHLSSDLMVKKSDEFTVGHSGADIAFGQYGLTGQGVTVAVIDSGALLHIDLSDPATKKTRIISNISVCSTEKANTDGCGHGTHVLGIIGGNGQSSTGSNYYHTFYGIARHANMVAVKALDRNGAGVVSDVISGIQWIVNNRTKYNIRVLNLSLGHPVCESYTTDPLCQAVEAAWKSGIVVVCAAGNNGRLSSTYSADSDNEGWGTAYGSVQSPGNDPYVITVGATKSIDGIRAHDRIATYSGRGPSRLDMVLKPDIIAPGNQVISLAVGNSYLDTAYAATNDILHNQYVVNGDGKCSGQYFRLSGTSMAAPVVAGAAALMLQQFPSLTPDTVKARLMLSADKWSSPDGSADACTYGAGYLNIPAALNCSVVATQYAVSPSLYQDNNGNVLIDIDRALWGTRAIWGTGITDLRAIWGTNALWGSNAVWGTADTLTSSRAIWGTSVWSDRAIWGTSSSAVDLSSTAIGGE